MQQDGVPGPVDRGQAGGGGPRRQHDPAVGVEQREGHGGQVQPVEHAVLVVDGGVAEEQRVVTENGALEEGRGLCEGADEEVCGRGGGREDEDDADEEERAAHRARLAVVEGKADGDEALHGHAGEDERGGAGGEHRRHDLTRTNEDTLRTGTVSTDTSERRPA